MNLPTWKETQRLAAIALVFYVVFVFAAPLLTPYVGAKFFAPHISKESYSTVFPMLQRFGYLLGNMGFAYWLLVLARKDNGRSVLWFLVGLFTGLMGVATYYLLTLCEHQVAKPQERHGV